MDMTLNEFKLLPSTCSKENYQPLTNDVTKDKYTGSCRLGLNSIFIPSSSPFWLDYMSVYYNVTEKGWWIYVN